MRSGELWVIRETPERIGGLGPYAFAATKKAHKTETPEQDEKQILT